jgi:TolB protein
VPTLTYAFVPGSGKRLFLSAVSFDGNQPIRLDASSTARTLVFQNELLYTTDPELAPVVMGLILTNNAVQSFAQVLEAGFGASTDPLQDPGVRTAFQKAVVSVLQGEGLSALAETLPGRRRPAASSSPVHERLLSQTSARIEAIENPNTRYLQLDASGLKLNMGILGYLLGFNPVDWLVTYQEIDVDAAFPNGTFDFDPIWHNWEIIPASFPTKGGFYTETYVGAKLASSQLNVVKTIEKALFKASNLGRLADSFFDATVSIPAGNAMYLVRAVGPGFRSPADLTFVDGKMNEAYLRAMAMNLASAALELVSLIVDDSGKDFVKKYSEYQGLALSILKQAEGINSPDDFERVAFSLSASMIDDYLNSGIKEAVIAGLQFEAGNLAPIHAALKKASAIGQVAERAAGLFLTTALETTFVEVGDPFGLKVGVDPAAASPGQTVKVIVSGSAKLAAFDPLDPGRNSVTFGPVNLDPGLVQCKVTGVKGPDGNGIQTLSVLIPDTIDAGLLGQETLLVKMQGRSGTTPFKLSPEAALQSVDPKDGFAPVANFQGKPFDGTIVRLRGAVFTGADTFYFAGTSGPIPCTYVVPNQPSGDVTVAVPKGAVTGPIKIVHALPTGGTLSIDGPVFTVWGPPTITGLTPAGGAPVGGIMRLTADSIGTDPSVIYAQFPGTAPQTVTMLPDNALLAPVPDGAQSGSLVLSTPAGSTQIDFNLLPFVSVTEPRVGATIRVGGGSSITLARAIAFARGSALPTLNEFTTGIGSIQQYTNIPSGAPWGLGRGYADTISVSGTVADDAVFDVDFATISGSFSGNVSVLGARNWLSGSYSGPVSVSGASNYISANVSGPLTVSGRGNHLVGSYSGAVRIDGSYNGLGQDLAGTYHATFFSAPVMVTGDGNNFSLNPSSSISGVPGDGLVITGDGNTGTVNCSGNAGDGLVIRGGAFNTLTVYAKGNAGNGVTLTEGAEGNSLNVTTGGLNSGIGSNGFAEPGTGNQRNGVLLTGSASGNVISGIGSHVGGNQLDGILLDGVGVTQNRIYANTTFNGRNGITLTNGAAGNKIGTLAEPFYTSFGSSPAIVYSNSGSGVVCNRCGTNRIYILAQRNSHFGFFAANIAGDANSFPVAISTISSGRSSSPLALAGNGQAGVRLEQSVTGLNIQASLAAELNGIEFDGVGVAQNNITATVYGALANGAVVGGGAHDNTLTLGVSSNRLDGILLQGATNNALNVFASTRNGAHGIHLMGSRGNSLVAVPGPSIYAGSSVGTLIAKNSLDGVRIEAGSWGNVFDSFTFTQNIRDGFSISGGGSVYNVARASSSSVNGRAGIRFDGGASENYFGQEESTPTDPDLLQVFDNGVAGVWITDAGTAGNSIAGCQIGGIVTVPSWGILVENGAEAGQITACSIDNNTNAVVLRDGVVGGFLGGLQISRHLNSSVVIFNSRNIVLGGAGNENHIDLTGGLRGIEIMGLQSTNNQISNTRISGTEDAVSIHDGATQNFLLADNGFDMNARGVRISGASNNVVAQSMIRSNTVAGVVIESQGRNNTVSGNVINSNGTGVLISDSGSIGNRITMNSIFDNAAKGITLADGGNQMMPAPKLTSFSSLRVKGTTVAPDDSRIEIFSDSGDEGRQLLGSGRAAGGQFTVILEVDPKESGLPFNIEGTVTSASGDTSEFGGLASPPPIGGFARRLLYTSSESGASQIYLWIDSNTSVDLSHPGISDLLPAFSFDCNRVAFVSWRSGSENIYIMDAVTNAPARQLTFGGSDGNPAWLVPCKTVVFDSGRAGNPQIYSVDEGGANLKQLTTGSRFANMNPAPTPDGSRIAFISNRTGTNSVWVMHADGSGQTYLGVLPGNPKQLAVSPDGKTIAVALTLNGAGAATSEISLINIDGTGYRQLTSDGVEATRPTWTPDGTGVVFASTRTGLRLLHSIAITGGKIAPISTSPNIHNAESPSIGR